MLRVRSPVHCPKMGGVESTSADWSCVGASCADKGARGVAKSPQQLETENASPAMSDPKEEAAQEAHVLETIRSWLELRSSGNADGAALLSTSDIVVRTPLGAVSGIENVKGQIYASPSPPLPSHAQGRQNGARRRDGRAHR